MNPKQSFCYPILMCFLFYGCTITLEKEPDPESDCDQECPNSFVYYNSFSVETITLEALMAQIKVESSKPYEETGKIYFYNNSLFVNEAEKGLHVLEVSDPGSIQKTKFINLPGNVDISIQNNTLYADMYSALIQLDISALETNQLEVTDTKTKVFEYDPYLIAWNLIQSYEIDNEYFSQLEYEELNKIKGLGETVFISGVTYNGVKCNCSYVLYDEPYVLESTADGVVGSGGDVLSGQGGSLARFKIVEDYLYALSNRSIKIFKINSDGNLSNWSSVSVTWGIETLYRLEDLLFIGSTSGMFIYSIKDPGNPTFISDYEHFRACDPVVAEGDYAYVTLRSTDQWCANDINQLQIIDIQNIFEPKLVGTYNMFAPYGLAVRGDRVLVCDSTSGIKIIDVSNKEEPTVVHFIDDYDARDIILRGNTAYVITTTGIVIYDVTDFDKPVQIGVQQL